MLRDHTTFRDMPDLPRDPYAPGSRPVPGREFLASTMVEVDMALADSHPEEAEAIVSGLIDQAGYRLEEQVRASLRGRSRRGEQPSIVPALDIREGDRVYAPNLIGTHGAPPIRYRITQIGNGSKIRIDLEILLALASRDEMVQGVATRLFPAVVPLVGAILGLGGDPFRMLQAGGMMNGKQVTVLVGIGRFGAARVHEAGQLLRDTIQATDESEMGEEEG